MRNTQARLVHDRTAWLARQEDLAHLTRRRPPRRPPVVRAPGIAARRLVVRLRRVVLGVTS